MIIPASIEQIESVYNQADLDLPTTIHNAGFTKVDDVHHADYKLAENIENWQLLVQEDSPIITPKRPRALPAQDRRAVKDD